MAMRAPGCHCCAMVCNVSMSATSPPSVSKPVAPTHHIPGVPGTGVTCGLAANKAPVAASIASVMACSSHSRTSSVAQRARASAMLMPARTPTRPAANETARSRVPTASARGTLSQWSGGAGADTLAREFSSRAPPVSRLRRPSAPAVRGPVARESVEFARVLVGEPIGGVVESSSKSSWMPRKVSSVQVVAGDAESAPGNGVLAGSLSVVVGVDIGAVAAGGPGTTRASRHPAPIGNLGIRTHATRHDDDTIHLERLRLVAATSGRGTLFHRDAHPRRLWLSQRRASRALHGGWGGEMQAHANGAGHARVA